MEKRRSKRIIVSLEAEILSEDRSFAGIIENLSNEGLYVKIVPAKTPVDFTPGKPLKFIIQLPTGETLNLNCELKWLCNDTSYDLSGRAGMKIINPPPEYIDLLKK